MAGGVIGYNSERRPLSDNFSEVLFHNVPTEQVVPDEKIFNEFPIVSNVKLSLDVAAILVGGWDHRI